MKALALAEQALECIKSGQRYQAAELIDTLLTEQALLGEKWGAVARLAATIGEVDLALAAAEKYANVNTHQTQSKLQQAALNAELGQHNQALELIEGLPQDNALLHLKGTILSQLGQNQEALTCFNTLLTTDSVSGQTWLTYCSIVTFDNEQSPEFQRLLSAQNTIEQQDKLNRGAYWYALGKAYDDIANSEQALSCFQRGAALIGQEYNYNNELDQQHVTATINSFNSDTLNQLAQSDLSLTSPIFIMGLPRTGTTLIEQLLASHPDVAGGGELDIMRKATMEMGGTGWQFAKQFETKFERPEYAWEHLASTYLYLAKQKVKQPGIVLDKSLNNSRYMGIIGKMFPRSPVIWVKRSPEQAAWSCYKTCFNNPMPWSWSLTDIAAFFKAEEVLMSHWARQFPEQILTLNYEDFVAEPERYTEQILAHCQLSQQPLSQHFYQTARAVTTASTVQVRRPIYQSSVAGAQPYHAFMQTFREHFATNNN